MDKAEFGMWAEEEAARHLVAAGWLVLARNVRFREGEIDLILERAGELLFVEVKARRGRFFGEVVESLTPLKVLHLKRAVYRWRERSGDRRPGQLVFLGVFVDAAGKVTMQKYLIE